MDTDSPPQGLFFTGSDDGNDNDDVLIEEPQPGAAAPESKPRLFFADSDDDEETHASTFTTPMKRSISVHIENDGQSSDVDIPSFEEIPRASSISSMTSSLSGKDEDSSPAPYVESAEPPTKRRRMLVPFTASQAPFESIYIGSFIVGNAWSTVRGKGYVKSGDEIQVEREDQVEGPSSKESAVSKKGKKGKATEKGKTKQLSIATMMKAPQPKTSKKKTNTVVRLTNSRGFEFGRLPTDVASWVSKLLDQGMIEFKGSTMIDCPAVLHSGADLIVSLPIYLCSSAFKPPSTSAPTSTIASAKQKTNMIFNEGQETLDEQVLRERKSSLLKLFDAVGLKPRAGADFAKQRYKSDKELHEEAVKNTTQAKKPPKIEIVGDGEEVEVEEGEDLSENELDMIYKKAQANDRSMGEMEPPDAFTLTLRGYQKQALLWMCSLENGEASARDAVSMHPLWSEYVFPSEPIDGIIDLTSEEQPFYFNPYSGELSLTFPKAETKCKGGILADGNCHFPQANGHARLISFVIFDPRVLQKFAVGMGKTIMLSALILTNCEAELIDPELAVKDFSKQRQLKLNNAFRPLAGQRPKSTKGPSATLIVAPTSLLNQWNEEIQRSSKPGTVKVLVWHGQNRLDLEAAVEADDSDDKLVRVVITSYGVLASEHAKGEKSGSSLSPIFQIEWLRVVLDEAHHCKSRQSKTARAVYGLRARRRWAVTGTPIVNKLEDLYSLLKFLDFSPWSGYSFFRSFITLPFLDRDPKAIEIVQVILESVLLRREKNMRDSDGNRIVELPAKEVTVENLEFSPLERKIYDSMYSDAKKNFDRLSAKGLIGKNYTHILAMLMRLRRAVLHPSLVLSSEDQPDSPPADGEVDIDSMIRRFSKEEDTLEGSGSKKFAEGVLANLSDLDPNEECPICLDVMQSPMIIPACMHQCCKDCIVCYLASCEERGEEPRCPTCSRGPVKESDLLEIVRSTKERGDAPNGSQNSLPEVILRRNDFRSSTKLEALVQNLRRLRDQDPCFRAVIFSQFTSFLDLIEVVLKRERLDWYRFDGSMDIKRRNEAVSEFRSASRKPKVLIVSLKAGGVGLNLTTANHVFMMDCWWNAATENQAIDRVHRIGQEKTVYVKHFIVADTIEGRILQIQKRKTAIVKEAFRDKDASGSNSESMENLKIMFGDM